MDVEQGRKEEAVTAHSVHYRASLISIPPFLSQKAISHKTCCSRLPRFALMP